MADTQWEKTIDEMVKLNISIWWQVYALPGGGEVDRVVKNSKYILHFGLENVGSEVYFEQIEVRIVTSAPPAIGVPYFQFYSDRTFSTQISRVEFRFNDLQSGGICRGDAYFIANITEKKGGDLVLLPFEYGIYARVRPEGHFWRKYEW